MLNALLAQSCFLFQQNKHRQDVLPQASSFEIASESASFSPKFESDAFSSPPTSDPPVLCIRNDLTPERLQLCSCKMRHKTRQWLWTRLSQIPPWNDSRLSHLSVTFSRSTATTVTGAGLRLLTLRDKQRVILTITLLILLNSDELHVLQYWGDYGRVRRDRLTATCMAFFLFIQF